MPTVVARVAAPWVLASAYFAADLGAFFAPLSAGGGGGRDAARPAASAGAAAAPALASSSRSTGGCGLDILVDEPDLQLALVEQPRAPDARALLDDAATDDDREAAVRQLRDGNCRGTASAKAAACGA